MELSTNAFATAMGPSVVVLSAGVVPLEVFPMTEDAPPFELSYWEMVAFIYGIYYALFLLLELQLTFSRDYYELKSINNKSRYYYLENYRLVQNRNRSQENELTIFKNICCQRR